MQKRVEGNRTYKQMGQRTALRRPSDWQGLRGTSFRGWAELSVLFLLIFCFTVRVTRPERVHFHAYQSRTSAHSRFTDGYDIGVETSSKIRPCATSTLSVWPRSLSMLLPGREFVSAETGTIRIFPRVVMPSLRAPPPLSN